MANENVTSEFDKLLSDLLGGVPETVVCDVEDVGDEPAIVSAPVIKMETIGDTVKFVPSQPVEVKPAEKPVYKQDEGKQSVAGAPFDSTVYSRGYVSAKWNDGWRFANKAAWYLEELEALEKFFGSPEYFMWKGNCINAGLRHRRKQEG